MRAKPRIQGKQSDSADPAEDQFIIETLPNGRKIAVLKDGYGWGDHATATFICHHRPLLERAISTARIAFLCSKSPKPTKKDIAAVLEKQPEIQLLCTEEQVAKFLIETKVQSNMGAAVEALASLFPSHTQKYIERKGRDSTYSYKPKAARTFRKKS